MFGHGGLHFLAGGPDVAQEHGFSFWGLSNWLGFEIDVDGSGECVGDYKEGRGEVVCAEVGVDAT